MLMKSDINVAYKIVNCYLEHREITIAFLKV